MLYHQISVLKEGDVLFERTLPRAGLVRIGRGQDCEICISDADDSLSFHHAKITYNHGRYWIRNDEGLAGTIVNGNYVHEWQPLNTSDVIVVGGYLLRFSGRADPDTDAGSVEQAERAVPTVETQIHEAMQVRPAKNLDVVQLSFPGGRILSVYRSRFTIGRRPENTVQLDSPSVADAHAIVFRSEHDWVIQNLDESGGLMVDAVFVDGSATIRSGQRLRIGSMECLFEVHASEGTLSPA